MKIKPVHILGVVVIVAALIFGASAFQSALTPYISIAEAKTAKGLIQVSGLVKDGKSSYDANGAFTFVLTDDQGNTISVTSKRVKPANFDQAIGVVAVGRYKDGVLEADQLLVKCPSKYEAQYGPTKAPGQ
jgi:cytochrome c-type biogenesis protein CcmE